NVIEYICLSKPLRLLCGHYMEYEKKTLYQLYKLLRRHFNGFCDTSGRDRTGTSRRTRDFESRASANSATLACDLYLEAATGFEPGVGDLQSPALPLGYAANKKAEDGERTRDPHLGKVVFYRGTTSARAGLPGCEGGGGREQNTRPCGLAIVEYKQK